MASIHDKLKQELLRRKMQETKKPAQSRPMAPMAPMPASRPQAPAGGSPMAQMLMQRAMMNRRR